MSTYIETLASDVMSSDYPAVVAKLCEANAFDLMLKGSPETLRWSREQASRAFLGATLVHARIADLTLVPAVALRIAARIAERSAAVTRGGTN